MLLFGINQHGETQDYLCEILKTESFVGENSSRNLKKTRQTAQDNNTNAQVKNKSYVDNKRCVVRKYDVRDYVMVKNIDTNLGENKKHISKFKGPYEI